MYIWFSLRHPWTIHLLRILADVRDQLSIDNSSMICIYLCYIMRCMWINLCTYHYTNSTYVPVDFGYFCCSKKFNDRFSQASMHFHLQAEMLRNQLFDLEDAEESATRHRCQNYFLNKWYHYLVLMKQVAGSLYNLFMFYCLISPFSKELL